MKQHIIDFFKYLESKGEKKIPLRAKLFYPDKFSPITKEDLNVEGDLYLQGINVTTLPDNLTVGGSLYIWDLRISSLPNNLKVGGSLWLTGSKIKSLPDNLTVGGSLHSRNSKIKSLPDNLKVGESLYIAATPLARRMTREEIRQEIEQKGGYVKGSIYM